MIMLTNCCGLNVLQYIWYNIIRSYRLKKIRFVGKMAHDHQETNSKVFRSDMIVIVKALLTARPSALQYCGTVICDKLTNCSRKRTPQTSSELLPVCFSYSHFAIPRLSRVPFRYDVVTGCFSAMYKYVILRIITLRSKLYPSYLKT
jgi:hypothetical protein